MYKHKDGCVKCYEKCNSIRVLILVARNLIRCLSLYLEQKG